MSAGPTARLRTYKSLCRRVRSTRVLVRAWHAIRRNAETSRQEATKNKAKLFGEDLPKNLRTLQARLKAGYRFAPAYGALPPKGHGKAGKRPDAAIDTMQKRAVSTSRRRQDACKQYDLIPPLVELRALGRWSRVTPVH